MLQQGQGIGRYIDRLISWLLKLETEHVWVIFLRDENWDLVPDHPQIEKVKANISWYSWQEQIYLPGVINRAHVDLMHFPQMNVPVFCSVPYVVTIHDLILVKHPASATSAASTRGAWHHSIKYAAYRLNLFLITKRSKKIITVCQYVKKDIINLLHVANDRVVVTYEAAEEPASIAMSVELPSTVKRPYIFCAGNSFPHKNLDVLLTLAQRLKEVASDLSIVLVGFDDFFAARLRQRIIDLGLTDRMQHLGCVSEELLDALFRQASAYVFPSFEEGFGFPGLEAMWRDVPVVASNSSCLPEIFGDAAVYFDPQSSEQIFDAVMKVTNDHDLRRALIDRGRIRVRQFSWERCARETLEVYLKAV